MQAPGSWRQFLGRSGEGNFLPDFRQSAADRSLSRPCSNAVPKRRDGSRPANQSRRNSRARKTMVQLAWLWLRYQPESSLARWFRNRVGELQGRTRRIAIVAMARKLLIAIWRFITWASCRRAPSSQPELRSSVISAIDWRMRPSSSLGASRSRVSGGSRQPGSSLVHEALWSPVRETTLQQTGTVCKVMQRSLLRERSQSNPPPRWSARRFRRRRSHLRLTGEPSCKDEARIGQKNGLVRQWARRGTRPTQPADRRRITGRAS